MSSAGDLHGPRGRFALLCLLAVASTAAFAAWQAILNNFAVERASFDGLQMGVLQSLREVPGFLAFTAVWVLLVLRQQSFALLALGVLGAGTAATGLFPSYWGLIVTTVVMSTGYHYLETMQQALALQWLPKAQAPALFGRLLSVKSLATLLTFGGLYGALWLWELDYAWLYAATGGIALLAAIGAVAWFPQFREDVPQRRELFLRRRYWLYYLLTFLGGARRQIFVVFAAFLLVERFGVPVQWMVLLHLVNAALTMWLAPAIGRLIGHWGERRALTLEYVGLAAVFAGYAFVEHLWVAVALYLLDHVLFSMAIAIKTYFQKIADPADLAATAGIAFTINHIAAVVLPAALGVLWLVSPAAVFLCGTALALCSLGAAQLVPRTPAPGAEVALPGPAQARPADQMP